MFLLKQRIATCRIVVFGVSFENFPILSQQIWKALVKGEKREECTFYDYTEFLYTITRGTWKGKLQIIDQRYHLISSNLIFVFLNFPQRTNDDCVSIFCCWRCKIRDSG